MLYACRRVCLLPGLALCRIAGHVGYSLCIQKSVVSTAQPIQTDCLSPQQIYANRLKAAKHRNFSRHLKLFKNVNYFTRMFVSVRSVILQNGPEKPAQILMHHHFATE